MTADGRRVGVDDDPRRLRPARNPERAQPPRFPGLQDRDGVRLQSRVCCADPMRKRENARLPERGQTPQPSGARGGSGLPRNPCAEGFAMNDPETQLTTFAMRAYFEALMNRGPVSMVITAEFASGDVA